MIKANEDIFRSQEIGIADDAITQIGITWQA